jgi:DNA-binding GntR family transcriptional regulator
MVTSGMPARLQIIYNQSTAILGGFSRPTEEDTVVLARLSTAPSRREQVLIAVREAIVSGELPPGQQLKQDGLAEQLAGVVREVLRQLENEGLVRHEVNRGVFVSDVRRDELLELLLPVRVQLENYSALRALPGLARDGFAALEEHIVEMAAAAANGDIAALNDADVAYHRTIVDGADSIQARQLWASILPRIRAELGRLAPRHADLDEIVAEHRLLLDVLRRGDPVEIHATLDEHILGVARALDPA